MANRNTKRYNNEMKKARAQQRWWQLLARQGAADKHKVTIRKSK